MTSKDAVVVYDLSGTCGWALYAPGLTAPKHGILKLPPTMTNGSIGPAMNLLFNHIGWIDRNFGLGHLGYEAFLSATGGKKDDGTTFITSPKTTKKLVGCVGVAELCADILDIEAHPIHNMSWRSKWLGSQKRGTKRPQWKALAVAKARALGWEPLGDDDADAIGQLHFLLSKLEITPPWRTSMSPSLDLGTPGVPLGA
jgi:hypothetical protein